MKFFISKLKQYKDTLLMLLLSFITAFILAGLLDGDWFKGIFAGVFMFLFYNSYEKFFKIWFSDGTKEYEKSLFSKKMLGALVLSLFLLGATSIITGAIFSYLINYCDKNSFSYSKKHCAIYTAKESILEQYASPYDYDDY